MQQNTPLYSNYLIQNTKGSNFIMKTMKKIFALTLALMLVFSLALTANAANLNVDGALKGATYNMYQMATVQKNDTTGSILYFSTAAWEGFWTSTGATWFDYNTTTKQVTIKDGVTDTQMPAAAKAAKAYAANQGIEGATATAADGEASFTNVDQGYYLMTSDKGSLCTLATITNDTTIKEKNATLPNVKKTVDDEEVAIGDTVTFTLDITTGENHDNEMKYVIHDTMSDGLALVGGTIKVQYKGEDFTDYTIETACTDSCSFAIVFGDSLTTAANDTITVTYDAIVTKEIGKDATNTAKIEDSTSTVTVTTTEFTLNKVDGDGDELAGAKFELYYATTTGEGADAVTEYIKVPVFCVDEEENIYRPAVGTETGVEIEAGTATVKGLDPDVTYYVLETQAPTGYVKIDDHKAVANGTVTVVNVEGDELPETGGMGTTLFYTLGGMMVAAAAVLLVTKKRMSAM